MRLSHSELLFFKLVDEGPPNLEVSLNQNKSHLSFHQQKGV